MAIRESKTGTNATRLGCAREIAAGRTMDTAQVTLEGLVEAGDRQIELEGVDQGGATAEEAHVEGWQVLGHPAQLDGDRKPVDGIKMAEGGGLLKVGLGAMDSRKVADRILGDIAAIPVVVEPQHEWPGGGRGHQTLRGHRRAPPVGIDRARQVDDQAARQEEEDSPRRTGAAPDGQQRARGVACHDRDLGPPLVRRQEDAQGCRHAISPSAIGQPDAAAWADLDDRRGRAGKIGERGRLERGGAGQGYPVRPWRADIGTLGLARHKPAAIPQCQRHLGGT